MCVYFADHETAMSAVRNLNGTDVKGRPLRIDLADSDPFLEGKTTNRGELDDTSGQSKPRDSGGIGTVPPGVPVPPGSTALDVISNVIATMQPQQLMDIMGHMKNFVHNSPEQARNLLQSQPQLSYALFQAMLMNQIVDPSVLQVSLLDYGVPCFINVAPTCSECWPQRHLKHHDLPHRLPPLPRCLQLPLH